MALEMLQTVGLVPSQQLVSLLTDENGEWRDVPEIDGVQQTVVPLVKLPKPEQGAWDSSLVWFADRVERQWIAGTPPPAPAFTAEQHLANVGLGGDRQPTLIYLKLQLSAAGKTSAKLAALESYLNGILAAYASDPSPRSDWPQPPVTFEAAVAEAVGVLQG